MKVLIVWPDIDSSSRFEVNMGISSISAMLKQAGHETLLYHPRIFSKETFLKCVESFDPNVIGFSVTTHQYQFAIKYARFAKECRENITTIFGGVHPTLTPESVIENPYVDMVCRGEGEFATVELVEALEKGENFSNIQNIWIKKNGSIIKNPKRDLIENLDSLPFPDREFINQKEILRKNGFRLDVSIGRGCPYQCPYCCNSALSELYKDKGKFVRLRSPENVLKEIDSIVHKYTVKEIHFQDDMFLLNKNWLREFGEPYAKDYHIPFHIAARVDHVDSEITGLLRQMGCISVSTGVETGNEKLRRNVLDKKVTNEQIIKAVGLLKEAGIKVCSLNMVGIPGETIGTINETISFNKKLNPNWLGISIFSPYPGTRLYNLCVKKGYIAGDSNFEDFSTSYMDEKCASVLSQPSITREETLKGYRRFIDFAIGKYLKEKYPFLYPFFIIGSPILKTKLRNIVIQIGTKLVFDSARFRKVGK